MVSQNLTLLFALMMAVMMMVMMMLYGLRMKKAVMKLRNLFLLLIPTVWQFVTTNYGTSLSMDCKYEPYMCVQRLLPLHERRKRRLKQRPRGDGSDKSEKRVSLLQEDHLSWPNNQITIKPLLTL